MLHAKTPPSLWYCDQLLGDHGIIQFAQGRTPDLDSGFCLDDNARALLVAVAYRRLHGTDAVATRMGQAAIDFFADASREAPCYHNVMNRDGNFTDECASPESVGRLIWALGITATCSDRESWRSAAWSQLREISHAVGALSSSRARAYAMLGLSAIVDPKEAAPIPGAPLVQRDPEVAQWAKSTLYAMAASMRFEFERNVRSEWKWWEPELTYDNARLPEAMLRAAIALRDRSFGITGLTALDFLMHVTQPNCMFVPVGAPGWYHRDGDRPIYDQQPLEAAAQVDMLLAAAQLTGEQSYADDAYDAYEWFFGNNILGVSVADAATGGCHDAIVPNGLNPNMGAESTLAYLQAALFIDAVDQPKERRARRSIKRSRPSAITASTQATALPDAIMEG